MIVTVCRSNNNISDGDVATVKQPCSWRQQQQQQQPPTLPATQWRSQQEWERKEKKQIKLLSVEEEEEELTEEEDVKEEAEDKIELSTKTNKFYRSEQISNCMLQLGKRGLPAG